MVEIPQEEIVDINSLTTDGFNPNKMGEKEFKALKFSIEKYGFIIPIITNKDLLVADGEHRLIVAKEMGMKEVKIIRLPIKDIDRRILRQVLNKLKGEHDGILDALEMEKIVKAGDMKNLVDSLGISERWVNDFLNAKKELPEQYFSMRMLSEEEQKKYDSQEVVRLSLNLTLEQVELIKSKIQQDEMYKKIFKMEDVFML